MMDRKLSSRKRQAITLVCILLSFTPNIWAEEKGEKNITIVDTNSASVKNDESKVLGEDSYVAIHQIDEETGDNVVNGYSFRVDGPQYISGGLGGVTIHDENGNLYRFWPALGRPLISGKYRNATEDPIATLSQNALSIDGEASCQNSGAVQSQAQFDVLEASYDFETGDVLHLSIDFEFDCQTMKNDDQNIFRQKGEIRYNVGFDQSNEAESTGGVDKSTAVVEDPIKGNELLKNPVSVYLQSFRSDPVGGAKWMTITELSTIKCDLKSIVLSHGEMNLAFESPSEGILEQGKTYNHVDSFYTSHAADEAGMSVRYDTIDCAAVGGFFTIHELQCNQDDGTVEKMALDFQQYCDGNASPMGGFIRIHSHSGFKDTDGDGILDLYDNCINIRNKDQADTNNNGIGDVCEPESNKNGQQGPKNILHVWDHRDPGAHNSQPLSTNPLSFYMNDTLIMEKANVGSGVIIKDKDANNVFRFVPKAGQPFIVGEFMTGPTSSSLEQNHFYVEGTANCAFKNDPLPQFRVLEANYDFQSGNIDSLAVDFAYTCTRSDYIRLGYVRYNSQIPTTKNAKVFIEQEKLLKHPIRDNPFLKKPTFIYLQGYQGNPVGGDGIWRVLPNLPTETSCDDWKLMVVNDEYKFEFASPNKGKITTGTYENATGQPFDRLGMDIPGMSILNNSPCSDISGRYVIRELECDGNELVRLAVDFVQYCGKDPAPLIGFIRINSSGQELLDTDGDGILDIMDECPYDPNPAHTKKVGNTCDAINRGAGNFYIDIYSDDDNNYEKDDKNYHYRVDNSLIVSGGIGQIKIKDTSYNNVIVFSTPVGFPLTVGNYENAVQNPAMYENGFSYSGLASCPMATDGNDANNNFRILEVKYHPETGEVLKFAADFAYVCDDNHSKDGAGSTANRRYGKIRYNSNIAGVSLNTAVADPILDNPNIKDSTTFAVIENLRGNYPDAGRSYVYPDVSKATCSPNWVLLQVGPYTIRIVASEGGELQGNGQSYDGAKSTYDVAYARLDVTTLSSKKSCNIKRGRFIVHEFKCTGDGNVDMLAIDFAQYMFAHICDEIDQPMVGYIRINSSKPIETIDSDGDGIVDIVDNCVNITNPTQEDFDMDGIGDPCDDKIDWENIPDGKTSYTKASGSRRFHSLYVMAPICFIVACVALWCAIKRRGGGSRGKASKRQKDRIIRQFRKGPQPSTRRGIADKARRNLKNISPRAQKDDDPELDLGDMRKRWGTVT